MIHDPLAKRSKAVVFSSIACIIACAGAGALAIFSPDPQPGDTPILQASNGQYYTRIDEVYHPVLNLTSAKLIVGDNAEVGKVGDRHLKELPRGVPVGIPGAPDTPTGADDSDIVFSVCHTASGIPRYVPPARTPLRWWEKLGKRGDDENPGEQPDDAVDDVTAQARTQSSSLPGSKSPGDLVPAAQAGATGAMPLDQWRKHADGFTGPRRDVVAEAEEIVVTTQPAAVMLAEDEALLAEVDGQLWLITRQWRHRLPPAHDPLRQAILRFLNVTPTLGVWRPPAAVLDTINEAPPFQVPADAVVVRAGGEYVVKTPTSMAPITREQAMLVQSAGYDTVTVARSIPRVDPLPLAEVHLPERSYRLVDASVATVCVTGDESLVSVATARVSPGVELPGSSTATVFEPPTPHAVAVDTGSGTWIISSFGARHQLPDRALLGVLGVEQPARAPWSMIRLLPEGQTLDRQAAIRPSYQIYQDPLRP